MQLDVVNNQNQKVGALSLNDEVFGGPVNGDLIWESVVHANAADRRGTHMTKNRALVSGSGKKPWRQKGTGRARQGSTRAPQWTGGGVVHGPQPRDHSMRVNKKMKKGALRSALTDAVQSNKLVAIDDFGLTEPKTKQAAQLLERLDATTGKILVVVPAPTQDGAVEKSFRNIEGVRVSYAGALGVYEVLAADKILVTNGTLDVLEGKEAAADHDVENADDAEPDEDVPAPDQEVGE
jgi:large subunit ribosomal protein L4